MALGAVTLTEAPLVLRPFEGRDVPTILAASTDPLLAVPSPCDEATALAYIERQHERLRSGAGWSPAVTEGGAALGQMGWGCRCCPTSGRASAAGCSARRGDAAWRERRCA